MSSSSVDVSYFSEAAFDVKRWINSVVPAESAESALQTALTRVHLFKQDASHTLDDTLAHALVRLPRTMLELERLGAESTNVSQQLHAAHTAAEAYRKESESTADVAQTIANHEKTLARLQRCSDLLRRAAEMNAVVGELEQSLAAHAARTDPHSSVEALVETASKLQRVKQSLAELRAIDASFGMHYESTIHGLDTHFIQAVERECAERLRTRDGGGTRLPSLMRAVHAVGRGAAVLADHAAHVVRQRRDGVVGPLRTANDEALPGAVAAVGAALTAAWRRENDAVVAVCASVPDAAKLVEGFHAALRAAEKEHIAPIVAERLQRASNSAIVATAVEAENAADAAAGEWIRNSLAPLAEGFAARERSIIETHDRSNLGDVVEVVHSSLGRCVSFLGSNVPVACLSAWNAAISDALRQRRTDALAAPTQGGDSTVVQQRILKQLRAAERDIRTCKENLRAIAAEAPLGMVETWLQSSLDAAENTRAEIEDATIANLRKPLIRRLDGYQPLDKSTSTPLAQYNTGSAAPSESVRSFGEGLMEIPLQFESLALDVSVDASAAALLQGLVHDAAKAFVEAVTRVEPTNPRGLEQLEADAEYVGIVLTALLEDGAADFHAQLQRVLETKRQRLGSSSATT